jgi:acyl dehydratase
MKVVPAAELKNFIGQELETGEWFEIDQQRINQFADVTEDRQFIHTDPEAAAQTPFGTTIAHGFLSLSMLTYLTSNSALVPENIVMGVNYGFDKVRFISPVKVNDKIRTRTTLKDVTEKAGGQYLLKQSISLEIEGQDKPALVCEWLIMHVVNEAA